jgi:chaperone BCS1
VTLSGLLNVLDGFSAPDHVLFVMSSNQIKALDPALVRAGRIDYRLHLARPQSSKRPNCTGDSFRRRRSSKHNCLVENHPAAETMAEFQGLLLGLEEAQNTCNDRLSLALEVEEPVAQ